MVFSGEYRNEGAPAAAASTPMFASDLFLTSNLPSQILVLPGGSTRGKIPLVSRAR